MEELKEEKALKEFSWKALFVVTALSCFIFSGVIKLLDGDSSGFFFKAGIVATVLSALVLILGRPPRNQAASKPEETC